ncbi:hypothetical protein BU16DRAFT_559073 [Lophium mytilinum]|uniref:Pentatricopeptide repeat protein n=1 Tax=Lophium mytilinum TaxID=390894 RepID=A0A6A6R023_9PEZI|nr:hypothetical protein BU16DRAFT_559073 [Lophium mytilinum]
MPASAPRAPSNGALSALRQAALYGSLGVTTGASLLLFEERRRRICICKQIIERGQIVSAYRRHLHNVAIASLRNEDPPELPFESPRPHPLSVSEIDKAYARATGQRRRARLIPEIEDEYNGELVAALAGVEPASEASPATGTSSLEAQSAVKSSNNTNQWLHPRYGYGYSIAEKGHANDSRKAQAINRINREVQLELIYESQLAKEIGNKRRRKRNHDFKTSGQPALASHSRRDKGSDQSPNGRGSGRGVSTIRDNSPKSCLVDSPPRNQVMNRLPFLETLQINSHSSPRGFPRQVPAYRRSMSTQASPALNIMSQLQDSVPRSPSRNQLHPDSLQDQALQRPLLRRAKRIANAKHLGSALTQFCIWYKADRLGSDATMASLLKRLAPFSLDKEGLDLKRIAIKDLKAQALGQVVDFFLERFPANADFGISSKASLVPDVAIVLLELVVEKPLCNSVVALSRRLRKWDCLTPPVLELIRQAVTNLLWTSREDDAYQVLLVTFGKDRTAATSPGKISLDTFFDTVLKTSPKEREDNKLLKEIISFKSFEDRWRKQAHHAVLQYLIGSQEKQAVLLIPEACDKSSSISNVESINHFYKKAFDMTVEDQMADKLLQDILSLSNYKTLWLQQIPKRCNYLLAKRLVTEAASLFTSNVTPSKEETVVMPTMPAMHLAWKIATYGLTDRSVEVVRQMYDWFERFHKESIGSLGKLLVQAYGNNHDYGPIVDLFQKHRDDPKFYESSTRGSIRPAVCWALALHTPYSVAVDSIEGFLPEPLLEARVNEKCLLSLPELLRRCWRETRNVESVESLAQDIKARAGFGSLPLRTISREMISIRRLALKNQQNISPSEWAERSPDTVADMLVYLAGQARWNILEKVLEDAHQADLLASIPMFTETVFNSVLKDYMKDHDSEATQAFVTHAIEKHLLIPNQRTLDLVVDALTKDSRVDAIDEWVRYLWAKGFQVSVTTRTAVGILRRFFFTHRPPHGLLLQLAHKLGSIDRVRQSSAWKQKGTRRREGLLSDRIVPLLQASMSFHIKTKRAAKAEGGRKELNDVSGRDVAEVHDLQDHVTKHHTKYHITEESPTREAVLEEDDFEKNGLEIDAIEESAIREGLTQLERLAKVSPSLVYANKLERQIANVDQAAKNASSTLYGDGLEATMTLALNQGKHEEVVNHYSRLLDKGLLGSQVAMEVAVEAALRSFNGDASKAAPIIDRAQELGMDVRRAQAPILHHRIISSNMSSREIHDVVFACFRNRSEGNLPPPHYIAVVAAHNLVHRMQPRAAVTLLIDVYLSSWAREMPVDIRFMTMFLYAYGCINNLRGIQWVVQNVLDGEMRIDRHFIDNLKQARRKSRKTLALQSLPDEMYQDRLASLDSFFEPWIANCETRVNLQLWRTNILGNQLVNVITTLRAPYPRGVVRRIHASHHVPKLKRIYRRRNERQTDVVVSRKRSGRSPTRFQTRELYFYKRLYSFQRPYWFKRLNSFKRRPKLPQRQRQKTRFTEPLRSRPVWEQPITSLQHSSGSV